MKHYLFFFVGLAVTTCFFSQSSILLTNVEVNATLTPNQVIEATTQASSNTKNTINVTNTSASTQTYNAKRYDIKLHSVQSTSTNAVAYFCIAGSCYGPVVVISQVALVLNPGQSASDLQGQFQMLVADLDEASTVGFSHVKYTFINVNNPADSVQISIKYNSSLEVGLSEVSSHNEVLAIYPNPANDVFHIKLNSEAELSGTIEMFSVMGQKVFSENVNQLSKQAIIDVDTKNYEKGIYFLSYTNNSINFTRKLVLE